MQNIFELFECSAEKYKNNHALWVDGSYHSYEELLLTSKDIGNFLSGIESRGDLIAVYASRSHEAYAGILGVIFSGAAYVPLNPKFPHERNAKILAASRATVMIVDKKNCKNIEGVAKKSESPLTIVFLGLSDLPSWCLLHSRHTFLAARTVPAKTADILLHRVRNQLAYVMFTSGSTGNPKGVPISHLNVISYLRNLDKLIEFDESDRFTQLFDLTFDLSVHDLFACWSHGACLYCVPSDEVFMPHKFIKRHSITVWFSVPSLVNMMDSYRLLTPDAFPSIRYSLFCGEPLASVAVRKWRISAPNSEIVNLYGPTEATICISAYKLTGVEKAPTVPIGEIFDDHKFQLLNSSACPAADEEYGELTISGPQIAAGYYNDAQATSSAFFQSADNSSEIWYRTGDIVRKKNGGSSLEYMGRVDQQIKVRGYRVELSEVENVIREAAGALLVAVVPVFEKKSATNISHLAAYVSNNVSSEKETLEFCARLLANYMMPKSVTVLETMPLNPNGKVDKKALTARANA